MGNRASILLVHKPSGVTSFTSLGSIKRTVDPKVGHAGTLDKFAEGLMIVLTGSMTRLNQVFSTMDKRYRATISFGKETDTLDPEGEVIATAEVPTLQQVTEAIPQFLGDIQQSPPQYSALHIGGKRASKLAREGKVVVMEKRPVSVYSFEVVSYKDGMLVADIHVSKGTYIRSLARDLALACESRGYLVNLVRTQIGPFLLEDAVDSTDTEALLDSVGKTDTLIRAIDDMALLEVEDRQLFSLGNGHYPDSFRTLRQAHDPKYGAVYARSGMLCCVLDLEDKRIIAQIHREQVRP